MMKDTACRIGCGYAKCTGRTVFVCNYLTGQSDYKTPFVAGKPCEKCAKTCKNNLCGECAKTCKNNLCGECAKTCKNNLCGECPGEGTWGVESESASDKCWVKEPSIHTVTPN